MEVAETLAYDIMVLLARYLSFIAQSKKLTTTEQHTLKNESKCLNTNIYCYLETSGGQSCNLPLNVHFSTPMLIKHL
jgi:hypothetical protein